MWLLLLLFDWHTGLINTGRNLCVFCRHTDGSTLSQQWPSLPPPFRRREKASVSSLQWVGIPQLPFLLRCWVASLETLGANPGVLVSAVYVLVSAVIVSHKRGTLVCGTISLGLNPPKRKKKKKLPAEMIFFTIDKQPLKWSWQVPPPRVKSSRCEVVTANIRIPFSNPLYAVSTSTSDIVSCAKAEQIRSITHAP